MHGRRAYILPPVSRIEIDRQASGAQAVTMEDSSSCVTASKGLRRPASAFLRSEPFIVAGLAKATVAPNPHVPWDDWVDNYDLIRDAIETTFPDKFEDLNHAMWQPGGYLIPSKARRREWETDTGKANFLVPENLPGRLPDGDASHDVFTLMTLRSNDSSIRHLRVS